MTQPRIAPYGSWKSPITANLISSEVIRLGGVVLAGETTYWLERRPREGGRGVIVRLEPDGRTTDLTPAPFNARTRAHEYGGGEYLVWNGTVFFSNYSDQRIYRRDVDGAPHPITPEAKLRFADGVVDETRGRLIYVREDHSNPEIGAINAIVSLDPQGLHIDQGGQILVWGNDFYSSPRVSPDGSRLAWLTWNHPNMPWDGCELWVARFDERGKLSGAELVAGGETESVFQPEWSPDGVLHFVSDRTGWWNLYRWRSSRIDPLAERAAEFGRPQWVFGMSTYAFASPTRIVCTYVQGGRWRMAFLDTARRALEEIAIPYSEVAGLAATERRAVFCGASPDRMASIVQVDLESAAIEILRKSTTVEVATRYLSAPEAVEFPTENGLTAHAFYYPPTNGDFAAPAGELPPLIVISHGGPTGATSSALNLTTQFWTSRGFAVLDVNYGGSTGYGRPYRVRLKGQWGVVDVDDCVNGARHLVESGRVDGDRLIIRGGSAGGYTTLCALAFRNLFRAGASHFGVSDPEALARDTHKFESHYLDQMIGPYPEKRELYLARSPLHRSDGISCPVIFFQGLEDRVVPPSQAEMMVDALRRRGVPFAYLAFEGEQHGFRRAENIERSLEAELYFYSQVFGFPLAETIEPVPIENLAQ